MGAVARVLNYASDTTGPEVYTERVVKEPVRYENGYLLVPEGHGLGVEVDEDRLQELSDEAKQPAGTDLVGLLDRTAGAVGNQGESVL